MSETLILWLFGIQFAVIIGLCKALFDHVKECKDVRLDIAEIKVISASIKAEIGDHESGMRGQLHDFRKYLVKLASKIPGGFEVFD